MGKTSKKDIEDEKKRDEVQCPLCGLRFKCDEAASCQACSLARKCHLLTCPNCGYKFPRI